MKKVFGLLMAIGLGFSTISFGGEGEECDDYKKKQDEKETTYTINL